MIDLHHLYFYIRYNAHTKLQVLSRRGKDLGTYNVSTIEELKAAFHKKYKKYYPSRQYYTIGNDKNKIAIKSETKFIDISTELTKHKNIIYFKDLGPQIGYRTVFYVEYFGPILVHFFILLFFIIFLWYKKYKTYMATNMGILYGNWSLFKREFESAFIHRFSHGTMPIRNIFKNSFHYWILGGLFIAYYLYHPLYTPINNDFLFKLCSILFIIFEIGNGLAHITLRNLRNTGKKSKYGNPKGGMFNFTSCANYTYEVFAWLVFNIATNTITGWFFY